ncbi:redoxin domain-containing protein [uncultured Tateyamaria sp.]|uniref:redoxin domain-containing protein n=1 Tax=uncultured Tateyamaria sp. TaxID=455651 RepID=UPI00260F6706|nr:redoxin domain-containing protein [uncultured Tateyamaria sp.]
MPHTLPRPGAPFPSITVPQLGGGTLALGQPQGGHDWQLVVVYRGKHCPLCTRYLSELQSIVEPLAELGIDVVAVSADAEDRAAHQVAEAGVTLPVGYGLAVDQMRDLGLYVSGPRHGVDVEGPFAEPGLFVVGSAGDLRMVDISNVPFMRPQLSALVGGLRFMRGRPEDVPANGTFA